jgi:hypothetical protein
MSTSTDEQSLLPAIPPAEQQAEQEQEQERPPAIVEAGSVLLQQLDDRIAAREKLRQQIADHYW